MIPDAHETTNTVTMELIITKAVYFAKLQPLLDCDEKENSFCAKKLKKKLAKNAIAVEDQTGNVTNSCRTYIKPKSTMKLVAPTTKYLVLVSRYIRVTNGIAEVF